MRARIYAFQEAVYKYGCVAERSGRPIARLMDPKYFDMFWLAWLIVPLSDNLQEWDALATIDYWHPAKNLDIGFRSNVDDQLIEFIVGGDPLDNGRLILRGPYPIDWSPIREDAGAEDE